MEWILMIIGTIYLLIAPFTKVEESFNLQAIHDILYHGTNISQYDHLEFPGVVPRTFLGPLVVAGMAMPSVTLARYLHLSKFGSQIIARAVLGTLVLFGFKRFRLAVEKHFGPVTGIWLVLVTASQFHFNFYLTRTLPNTFALGLVLLAYAFWLEQNHQALIITTAFAVIAFRFELAILLGVLLLIEMWCHRVTLRTVLLVGIPAGLASLGLTVMVDSWFWQRLIWPEGEVIWFNVILNKSSQYGVMPWGWYFYSALPRALCSTIFLAAIAGAYDSRSRLLLLPALVFVVAFSFLPHKELRFIIYTIPLFNTAAARILTFIWNVRLKSLKHVYTLLGVCMLLLLNFLFSGLLLYISSHNYPGGHALARVHEFASPQDEVKVHIDVYPAQTGASRFGELNPNWRYSKKENLSFETRAKMFTHLLVEASDAKYLNKTHEVVALIEGFIHAKPAYTRLPPIQVHTSPLVAVLRQRPFKEVIINAQPTLVAS